MVTRYFFIHLQKGKEPTEDNSSSNEFIIDQPTKRRKIVTTRKTSARATTRRRRMLTRAATAPGQRKVCEYFLTEREREFFIAAGFDPDNSNALPDLVRDRSPPPCIVIDSSSDDNDGPVLVCYVKHVSGPQLISSPVRENLFISDNPSLSPINSPPPTNHD